MSDITISATRLNLQIDALERSATSKEVKATLIQARVGVAIIQRLDYFTENGIRTETGS